MAAMSAPPPSLDIENTSAQTATERQFLAMVVQRWHPRLARVLRGIRADHLSVAAYQWFVPIVARYLDEHDVTPPWEYVDIMLAREYDDPDKLQAMRTVLWVLYSIEITWGDQAVQDFREHMAWRMYSTGFEAAQTGYRRTRSMRLALDAAARTTWEAATILQDVEVHDLMGDYEAAKADWARTRDNPGLKKQFQIGIPQIDKFLRLHEATVTAVLGSFKVGKSIILNHFSLAALLHGYNVVQIVYENQYELTRDRHFSRLMELDYNDLVGGRAELLKPDEWKRADAFMMDLCRRLNVRLKIIQADPKVTTVADVEGQLDVLQAEEGFEADVTIWDYANLIGIPKDRRDREERINQETVIWDLQRHAKDTKRGGLRPRIVVTAVQAKAEAINKEHLDASDFGKSIGIPQAVNALVGVSRVNQDAVDDRLKMSVLANRQNASSGEVPLVCDYSRMCIANSTLGWFGGLAETLMMKDVR